MVLVVEEVIDVLDLYMYHSHYIDVGRGREGDRGRGRGRGKGDEKADWVPVTKLG